MAAGPFSPLTVANYATQALMTDQRSDGGSLTFPLLGLFGETGSLLSEVKKKQRDRASYIGYAEAVLRLSNRFKGPFLFSDVGVNIGIIGKIDKRLKVHALGNVRLDRPFGGRNLAGLLPAFPGKARIFIGQANALLAYNHPIQVASVIDFDGFAGMDVLGYESPVEDGNVWMRSRPSRPVEPDCPTCQKQIDRCGIICSERSPARDMGRIAGLQRSNHGA